VRAGVAFIALAIAAGSRAAESGERLGAVVAARIEMQRQLGDSLTKSLQAAAEPYRIDAAVRLELRGTFHEVHAKQESASPAVKIGGKSTKVRLPGLGMVEGGGQGNPMLPEINIEGGTRVTESVSRQLETEVVKVIIRLFVEESMPKARREALVRLASELAAVDPGRGDAVIVEERSGSAVSTPVATPAGATVGGASVVQPPPPKVTWEVFAICAAAVLSAVIVAYGLSRRGASSGAGGTARIAVEGDARGLSDGASAQSAVKEAETQRKRREEVGAFKVLDDATPKEIVQVVSEADPYTAIAVVDLFGLPPEASSLLERSLTPQRRIDIGLGLAIEKVLSREQLGQMENVAAQILQRIRNRVPLGGPGRLAEFVMQAPASLRQEILEGVAARDQALAQAARSMMLLFEDLPRLVDASLRQVVSAVDPATMALALVGAPEAREAVLGAVSQRLRSIIEAEEESATGRPPEEAEKARRAIEDAMRVAHQRGELHTRATAEASADNTPPADTAVA